MTDTLSPTLTAWLARFTAEIAPQFTWRLNEYGRLQATHTSRSVPMCPLMSVCFVDNNYSRSLKPEKLYTAFLGKLGNTDARVIIHAADNMVEKEDYSPALRTTLLAACGVEEVP